MGHTYRETYRIPFELVDVNGNLRLHDFLAELLQISGRHSAGLGRSDTHVYDTYGCVWIVTDYEFTIISLPKINQTIQIKTEAVSYNKLICHRKFEIYDQADQLLLEIDAYFALMNFDQRKLVAVPDDLIGPYLSEKVKKIQRYTNYGSLEEPQVLSYPVRYFDLDINGHVNNSKYLEWVYESLGYNFLREHVPTKIHLKYVRELGPNKLIESSYQLMGKISHHQIASDGQVNAQARIEWRQVDEK